MAARLSVIVKEISSSQQRWVNTPLIISAIKNGSASYTGVIVGGLVTVLPCDSFDLRRARSPFFGRKLLLILVVKNNPAF
jgi:hypothetical protein